MHHFKVEEKTLNWTKKLITPLKSKIKPLRTPKSNTCNDAKFEKPSQPKKFTDFHHQENQKTKPNSPQKRKAKWVTESDLKFR
jgi:hypothetical protein